MNITIIKVRTSQSNVIRADLPKKFCNLRIRPIVIFTLPSTVFRCFSETNRVSNVIPSCFWDVACITLLLLLLLLLLLVVLLLLSTSEECDIGDVIGNDTEGCNFLLKMTFCFRFFEYGLKLIFH